MPFLPLQHGWGRDSARVRGVPLAHNPDERKKLTCLRLSDAIVLLLFTIHGGDISISKDFPGTAVSMLCRPCDRSDFSIRGRCLTLMLGLPPGPQLLRKVSAFSRGPLKTP